MCPGRAPGDQGGQDLVDRAAGTTFHRQPALIADRLQGFQGLCPAVVTGTRLQPVAVPQLEATDHDPAGLIDSPIRASSMDMWRVSAVIMTPGDPTSSTTETASANYLITKSAKRINGSRYTFAFVTAQGRHGRIDSV